MNKNFHFFCAIPRSGSTLLSSLINQSNQIKVSPNSILPDTLHKLTLLKTNSIFLNFPYHTGIDNMISNSFNNYYSNVNVKNILDKAPWGTPFNLEMLKSIFKDRKFLVLVRPVLECLASFVKIEQPQNIEERCNQLMSKEGIIGKNIWSINNLVNQNENYIKITYDDLIADTKNQINKICDFLNINRFDLNIDQISEYNFDNVNYEDNVVKNLHKIRLNEIKKNDYKIEKYLSNKIISKYKYINI